ncbi:PAS fold-containing protein [Aquimonas voraii]|uniref:PAS fold-containing protein n=2 Tax=Aquimonas voraii TaxID=265719 RepID=A0A1G7AE65_9GAMM|nr:PAS fold-containing protein [Aquimonas voraii]
MERCNGGRVVRSGRQGEATKGRCIGWLVTGLLVACTVSAQPAPPSSESVLEQCRQSRKDRPREALQLCESAAESLRAQDRFDDAFEALMHASQIATLSGQVERAQMALDRAALLLGEVGDPSASQRIARRRGQLAYARGELASALGSFLEALAIARSLRDTAAIAVSENDVGVVYWQMGDYGAALGHLQSSLEAKQELGDRDIASTLSNIGGLYGELGDTRRAIDMLERALAMHRDSGSPQLIGGTLEELALLEAKAGSVDLARDSLDEAWSLYEAANAQRERMRLALRRARIEAEHEPQMTGVWLDRAREAAAKLGRSELLAAEVIEARLAQTPEQVARAYAELKRVAQVDVEVEPALAPEAQALLAELAERMGRSGDALQHLREHLRLQRALDEARHSQRLDALRVRLDLTLAEAERDRLQRENALQTSEIERRRAQTLVLGAGALLVVAGLVLFFQRRLYLQRLQAREERQRLEQRIAEARRAADALRADLRSMEWLLDREGSPALVFDASGQIRAVTRAAAELLGLRVDGVRGSALSSVIGESAAATVQSQVEQASLTDASQIELDEHSLGEGLPEGLCFSLQRLSLEEELGVLLLRPRPAASVSADVLALGAAGDAGVEEDVEEYLVAGALDPQQRFRALLVQLMQLSLDLWERLTRKTRIDLAERSGVWRITIDEGRLRVRAMDRYLSLDTLPEKPRWREVLRTAYFVLAELELTPEQRQQMEGLIESVLNWTRKRP